MPIQYNAPIDRLMKPQPRHTRHSDRNADRRSSGRLPARARALLLVTSISRSRLLPCAPAAWPLDGGTAPAADAAPHTDTAAAVQGCVIECVRSPVPISPSVGYPSATHIRETTPTSIPSLNPPKRAGKTLSSRNPRRISAPTLEGKPPAAILAELQTKCAGANRPRLSDLHALLDAERKSHIAAGGSTNDKVAAPASVLLGGVELFVRKNVDFREETAALFLRAMCRAGEKGSAKRV